MRFAFLGSGSRGNAALIETGDTLIMLDCGFAAVEAERRLERLGRVPADINAIVVTHEHGDHASGVAAFARRHNTPVWMTPGSYRGMGEPKLPVLHYVNSHSGFAVDGLSVEPVPVPHDACEPCQYVFSDGAARLGILTDTGFITPHVRASFAGCSALLLECNHDVKMLAAGPYPPALKARVGGPQGHLNNDQAAGLLVDIGGDGLQHVIALHISEKNNTTELARGALAGALGCSVDDIGSVDQDAGLDWHTIGCRT